MQMKEDVIRQICASGVVAVIRGNTPEEARAAADACIEGGIRNIELAFTVPFAHRVIEDLAISYGDSILLGAGTVLDPETARIAMLNGAKFIVSPHFNAETVKLCNRYRVACMAGIMTVREAVEAMEAGTDILKLFPGGLAGPSFIKDLHGPLPQALIMPTGGVTVSNIGDWLRAGAVAVGASGSLMQGDIRANAAAFTEEVRKVREAL